MSSSPGTLTESVVKYRKIVPGIYVVSTYVCSEAARKQLVMSQQRQAPLLKNQVYDCPEECGDGYKNQSGDSQDGSPPISCLVFPGTPSREDVLSTH